MAQRRLGFWKRLAAMLVVPTVALWTRHTWLRLDRMPAEGGVILVANHVSQFDPLVVAVYVYRAGRWPQFLGKSSLWKVPFVGFMLRKTRQVPVERGSVEAAKSLAALTGALAEGGAVIVYPEGTTTREPDLWPMKGKTGAARLALLTGAPVVPVANWGAGSIHDPRTGKISFRRADVTVTMGDPVDLSRWKGAEPTRQVLEEMTEAIMLDVRDLLGGIRGETPPPLYVRPRRESVRNEGEVAG